MPHCVLNKIAGVLWPDDLIKMLTYLSLPYLILYIKNNRLSSEELTTKSSVFYLNIFRNSKMLT